MDVRLIKTPFPTMMLKVQKIVNKMKATPAMKVDQLPRREENS